MLDSESVLVGVLLSELGRFTAQPESVAVVEGQTARFQCSIDGSSSVPTPAVSWTKDGRALPQSDR